MLNFFSKTFFKKNEKKFGTLSLTKFWSGDLWIVCHPKGKYLLRYTAKKKEQPIEIALIEWICSIIFGDFYCTTSLADLTT